jgi:mono/diheme cytochrome c family protein
MRGIVFVLIMIICGCTGDGGNSSTAKKTGEGPQIDAVQAKFLFEIKCSACHPLERPRSARKNYTDWVATIDKMIENGAVMSDEEVVVIAAYLADVYGEENGT